MVLTFRIVAALLLASGAIAKLLEPAATMDVLSPLLPNTPLLIVATTILIVIEAVLAGLLVSRPKESTAVVSLSTTLFVTFAAFNATRLLLGNAPSVECGCGDLLGGDLS